MTTTARTAASTRFLLPLWDFFATNEDSLALASMLINELGADRAEVAANFPGTIVARVCKTRVGFAVISEALEAAL